MRGWLVKIVAAAWASLCCIALSAQEPADDEPYYDPFEDDFREITVDTALFYSPLGDGSTLFAQMSRYGFGFTSYRSRGLDERFARASLAGLELSSLPSLYGAGRSCSAGVAYLRCFRCRNLLAALYRFLRHTGFAGHAGRIGYLHLFATALP